MAERAPIEIYRAPGILMRIKATRTHVARARAFLDGVEANL